MKVGDHVKHRDRPDVGIGVIEEFFNNHCTVRFKEETFTGVPWQSFKLAEQEFQDEKRRIEREARGEKERKERQERALKRRKKLEAAEQQKREPIQSRMREILNKDFLNADTLVVGVDPDGLVDYPSLKVAWMKEKFQSILSEPEPNDEQLLAIGDFSKSTLVRARAGSGKTTVIKRKTSLLLTHLGVQSSEILVLAFNRAAADKINLDMQTKPESRFFTNAKTFHSLAHGIVSPSRDSILFDPPSKVRGPRYAFVEEILRKDDNPALLSDLYQFFRAEYSEIERIGALTSDQEYYTNLRNMEEETLGGDMVKSLGEKWIADFLFEHGIRYRYEQLWSWSRGGIKEEGEYQPDFSLYMHGEKHADVVIEHFGIDENDRSKRVPLSWNRTWQEYREEMERKRKYWRNHNASNDRDPVLFLESSVADMTSGTTRSERRVAFERRLYELFRKHGFTLRKLSQAELEKRIDRRSTSSFVDYCIQFIDRAKKQRISPEKLHKLASSFKFGSEKERIFLNIVIRTYSKYQSKLKSQQKIDFDDLIEMAISEIHAKKGAITISGRNIEDIDLLKINYLMIDEYQDFSLLFFRLIDAIRQFNPALKIFCVGDDWQAINGFAGSDLRFFSDFHQRFENASLVNLQSNYRSQPSLVKQANRFMAHTGGVESVPQAKLPAGEFHKIIWTNDIFINTKSDVSFDDNPDARFLYYKKINGVMVNQDRWGKGARLLKACSNIIEQYDLRTTTFRILSRNNDLGYPYNKLAAFQSKLRSCFAKEVQRYFDENVVCETVHHSKGAESEIVILLKLLDGVFPSKNPSNALFSILGVSSEKVFAEEERLFYVAITRPKQALYLVTEKNRESEFVDRIRDATTSVQHDALSEDDIPF